MRIFLLVLFLLPAAGFCEQVRLEVGASNAATGDALKKIAAVDITPNLDVEGAKGERPSHGLYWSVRDFKMILEIARDGKTEEVGSICFWTDEDFSHSKAHREDSRRRASSIVFDTEKKTFIVTKKPGWSFGK